MNRQDIEQLVGQLLGGKLTANELVDRLMPRHSAQLGEVTLDLDRKRRCGFPEVVFGEGKSTATLETIFRNLLESDSDVLATRVSMEQAELLLTSFPNANYNDLARTFRISASKQSSERVGRVAVVTAGTSDLPVAEEARETLDWMSVAVTMIHDVGVAGPHRLLERLDDLKGTDAVVVIAGLEGALPSVVGGHVACAVIAVPTSVGYGASFGGVAALLGMLNSCASNVTVVNIDAGFKGGYVAGLIARQIHREE